MSNYFLSGEIQVPGDKSITHRALMFSGLAKGKSIIRTNCLGRDNLATLRIMSQLGVSFSGTLTSSLLKLARSEGIDDFSESVGENAEICHIVANGVGVDGFKKPVEILNCGNSGTSARLLCGLLSGAKFSSTLDGDVSLRGRPFRRVIEPLTLMGAKFSSDELPFVIEGGSKLKGVRYVSPRASAQIKSAILLAGLQCPDLVSVIEPAQSRDHTECMLKSMGCLMASSIADDGSYEVQFLQGMQSETLHPINTFVPGDFSSASFFLVAASIIQGSKVLIRNVGFNPTRIGLFHLLVRMGAKIAISNKRESGGEPVVDLLVESSELKGIEVSSSDVVLAIDEIPIFAVAAAFAQGKTTIRGASELRVKESDRLAMIAYVLKTFGVELVELEDGLIIEGLRNIPLLNPDAIDNSNWMNSHDHRIAMSASVLQFALGLPFTITEVDMIETSFPGFSELFQGLIKRK